MSAQGMLRQNATPTEKKFLSIKLFQVLKAGSTTLR